MQSSRAAGSRFHHAGKSCGQGLRPAQREIRSVPAFLYAAWVVLMCLAGAVSAAAQTEPNLANGITPYGSFDEHEIGAVNLMNGNPFTHIPFSQDYVQRGKSLHNMPLLVMNGKTWTVGSYGTSDSCCAFYWTPVNTAAPGAASPQESLFPAMITRTFEKDVDPYGNVNTSADNYAVITWDGTQFGGQL